MQRLGLFSMQVEQLTLSQLSFRVETVEETMLNPSRLAEWTTNGVPFFIMGYALSSLTESDWLHYSNTGQISAAYDPRKDKVFIG